MDLTVLAVPDCPNVALLEKRLASALNGRRNVTLSRQVITDAAEAARWGMRGSPTVLVNGTDPFAVPGQGASVSCRLYRDENGRALPRRQLRSSAAPSIKPLGARASRKTAPGWMRSAGPGAHRACRAGPAGGASDGAPLVRADRYCPAVVTAGDLRRAVRCIRCAAGAGRGRFSVPR